VKDQECLVQYNEEVASGYFKIGLKTGWKGFVPGQFGMLEVPPAEGVLLRRPFSFARQIGEVTEILYKVVGKGTKAISDASPGSCLHLLGPLGRGFSIPEGPGEVVGVAGGYGIAPFLQLAEQLQALGRRLQLFYGARTKKDLLYIQEFNDLKVKLYITTEDGSEGEAGRVTELLGRVYAEKNPVGLTSCGPLGLLHAVQKWSEARGVPCELSVEETMGCGTGVCLGCVVLDRQGRYRRACVEGPVFPGEILNLEKS
jgi:dihydroorotate dehydrogenase electron transfer subunit